MKFVAIEKCDLVKDVKPFDKARLEDGKLYSMCNECLKHKCRVEVKKDD